MSYKSPLDYFDEYFMGDRVRDLCVVYGSCVIYPLYLQLERSGGPIVCGESAHVEFDKIHILQKDFTSPQYFRFSDSPAARDFMPFIEMNATLPEPEQFIMIPLVNVVPMNDKLYFGFVVSNMWSGLPHTQHALNVPSTP